MTCFEGWSKADGNNGGRCCCNCLYQKPIVKHPWNKTMIFRGSASDQIAWGCMVPDMPGIVLSEREHGMCEVHEFKEN